MPATSRSHASHRVRRKRSAKRACDKSIIRSLEMKRGLHGKAAHPRSPAPAPQITQGVPSGSPREGRTAPEIETKRPKTANHTALKARSSKIVVGPRKPCERRRLFYIFFPITQQSVQGFYCRSRVALQNKTSPVAEGLKLVVRVKYTVVELGDPSKYLHTLFCQKCPDQAACEARAWIADSPRRWRADGMQECGRPRMSGVYQRSFPRGGSKACAYRLT
ncbi:hypothetical protein NDU88_008477 [Pleurodeles waltl]|uniref:Uncharacterized protein n=1 Tax=Pleurodeles waltl TaxID=8319 RepID=A0AAV7PRQ0_PLEWA|nr:hypothetical protein NDU88_008477 [Pleurodeles waltl]